MRIIALANIDLKEAVRVHTFRDDLYYRLNVVTVTLPRLSERVEDIASLAEQFARHFASRNGRNGIRISGDALKSLSEYDYPGNVRELRNIIEQAVVACDGETIGVTNLPEYLRSAARLIQSKQRKPSLAEIEAVYIREVLEFTRGNKTKSAEILGISRKNLYEKMRRYEIAPLRPRVED